MKRSDKSSDKTARGQESTVRLRVLWERALLLLPLSVLCVSLVSVLLLGSFLPLNLPLNLLWLTTIVTLVHVLTILGIAVGARVVKWFEDATKQPDKPHDKVAKGQRWFRFVAASAGLVIGFGSFTLLYWLSFWLMRLFPPSTFIELGHRRVSVLWLGALLVIVILPFVLATVTVKALLYWYDQEARNAGLPPMPKPAPASEDLWDSPLLYVGGSMLLLLLFAGWFLYYSLTGAPP